jgi:hypothetical protein
MFDGLFQPMHLLWSLIIGLLIMWLWEGWRHWCRTRYDHNKFQKNHAPVLSTNAKAIQR